MKLDTRNTSDVGRFIVPIVLDEVESLSLDPSLEAIAQLKNPNSASICQTIAPETCNQDRFVIDASLYALIP